jgi:hypothetical protein
MIRLIIITALVASCTGKPLDPSGEGEGEGEGERVGEGEGEACAGSLCTQFVVTGGHGRWTPMVKRNNELLLFSDCLDGGVTLTSSNGSVVSLNDCQGMMASVDSVGRVSSPVRFDLYPLG